MVAKLVMKDINLQLCGEINYYVGPNGEDRGTKETSCSSLDSGRGLDLFVKWGIYI